MPKPIDRNAAPDTNSDADKGFGLSKPEPTRAAVIVPVLPEKHNTGNGAASGEDGARPEFQRSPRFSRSNEARLEEAGLAAFVKTSGGKGLHVMAPLKPAADWTAAKAFTKGLAEAMASDSPDLYVATISKAKRGGKILIDYLRNQRGATAVAAYSTRARPGAPVSMPVEWEDLGPDLGPARFTVDNTPGHIAARAADPFADFAAAAAPLAAPSRRKK